MEINIQNYDTEPTQKSRTSWFLIALIILLCIVTFVQGFMLFGMRNKRDSRAPGRTWHEQMQKALRGLADKSDQAALNQPDSQVVFWETTDDLEQIHDQINRLLQRGTTPFGAPMSGGQFPGIAMQRESGKKPQTLPPPGSDLNQLQREIEQIFEDAYTESQQRTLLSRFNHGWDMVPSATAMNIEDQGSNYVVTVALPGYDKQGIAVSLQGRLLNIEAAQTSRAPATATRTTQIESGGQFHTQIMMPDNIEGTGAQAAYEQDVLCVHIPKALETNSLVRSIAIR